jgi:hypothetical protein
LNRLNGSLFVGAMRGSGSPRLSVHDVAGVGADPLDHRGESVRALRRQVLGQPETPEHALRIDPNDLVRATTRVDRKEDGDQSPNFQSFVRF